MRTAVRRRWGHTIIWLTTLAVVLVGWHRYVYAQIVKAPGESTASLVAAIVKSSASQPTLGLVGADLTSLFGVDPSLSMMGFNPMLNPFISSPSMANSPLLMSALNSAMAMSAALLSQSMAGGISPGGGIGAAGYPTGAYSSNLTGGSFPVDAGILMNFFGMGGGFFPGGGGALNNIIFPGFAGTSALQLSPDQVMSMGSLSGLTSGLMVPPLSPFGLLPPSFSPFQIGGYPYDLSGMYLNAMMRGIYPYNPASGMPLNGMTSGVNPLMNGGYSFGGYFPFTGSMNAPVGSYPYASSPLQGTYNTTGVPTSRPDAFTNSAPVQLPTSASQFGGSSYAGNAGIGTVPYGAGVSLPPFVGSYAPVVQPTIILPVPTISIRAGIISGTVKDEQGNGLVGVNLEISTSGWPIQRLVTDASGYYPESVAFPGNGCALTISLGKSYTLYPNFPVAGGTVFNFVLVPGTVRDDVTKTPLSGVGIFAKSHAYPFVEAQTTTDSKGAYQLFLPHGEYTIVAKLPKSPTDSTNQEASPVVVPSPDNATVNFALNLPLFAGDVVDAIDKNIKLEGAEIKITPVSSTLPLPISSPVLTVRNGEFRIPLPQGQYELEVWKSKYQKRTIPIQIYGTIEDYHIELTNQQNLNLAQNTPPVIKTPQASVSIAVTAGDELSFSVEAEDPENSYLYFTITGPANWPKIINDGGPKTTPKKYRYPTTLADLGEYTMEITVDDLESPTTIYIKVKVQYPVQLNLTRGINLINYPAGFGSPVDSAFDLLSILGDANRVEGIARYDGQSRGKYIQASYGKNKIKMGTDFSINSQEGYLVYAKQSAPVNLKIQNGNLSSCILQLKQGTNLTGIPVVLSDTYSSYDLLLDFGYEAVESIYRYNAKAGEYEFTYWIGNQPGGSDFPIRLGEGYFIGAKIDHQLRLPKLR